MSVRFLVGDVFDRLAEIDDGTVDLVVTSPPFLALRSYLPADHPDKSKEIGAEATPADYLDTLLRVTAELRRVLAPHGSIAVELGDTYSGSGGGGGDYLEGGWREGQQQFAGSGASMRESNAEHGRQKNRGGRNGRASMVEKATGGHHLGGYGWPFAKSKALIPELYRIALAYGINPLTGQESPAGRWRVRNVVTWCRPNPPVGALGDKWRPATSDIVVACTSPKRYWDDLATRQPSIAPDQVERPRHDRSTSGREDLWDQGNGRFGIHPAGAPLLDYWVIPPTGYAGAHYAVYPPEIVVPLIKAMCPERVCRTCGEPSRRIVGDTPEYEALKGEWSWGGDINGKAKPAGVPRLSADRTDLGFSDCGHDTYRPGVVLDPFAGSGTTIMVAHGHGRDSIGIDLDERNLGLTRERIGPMFEVLV